MIVLDASAVLALLNDERGAERVEEALPRSALSTVNLSEVLAKVVELGRDPRDVRRRLESAGVAVQAFSEHHALLAAALRPATRSLGLSLGDRACLALSLDAAADDVLTADSAWASLELPLSITVLR